MDFQKKKKKRISFDTTFSTSIMQYSILQFFITLLINGHATSLLGFAKTKQSEVCYQVIYNFLINHLI